METIILASSSPQRQEYFRLLGLPFEVIPSPAKEVLNGSIEPAQAVEELALQKVKSVRELCQNRETPWIVGADTVITLDGQTYGKPKDRDDAGTMLSVFSGRSHEVITAVALYNGKDGTTDCKSVVSTVTFAPLSNGEIEWYLDSGEWQGAAGAYKIQGLASCFISNISGSYTSIVGLPLREFYVMLRDNCYF